LFGTAVVGKIIGVSMIEEEIQILIRATNDRLYKRKISDVRINGKFKKIKRDINHEK
jgi:hypothetical protein